MPKTQEQFDAWMALVDREVSARVGLGVYDLPDMLHRDAFEEGVKPDTWAVEVISNAAEDMGFDPDDILF